jgi:hypothetical protein
MKWMECSLEYLRSIKLFDINLSYTTHRGITMSQFLMDIHYRVDVEGFRLVLPKTMTKVILIVFIFALGMSPLELARLEFGSSMETSSPSANPKTKNFSMCPVTLIGDIKKCTAFCDEAVLSSRNLLTFQMNVLPPSSGWMSKPSK